MLCLCVVGCVLDDFIFFGTANESSRISGFPYPSLFDIIKLTFFLVSERMQKGLEPDRDKKNDVRIFDSSFLSAFGTRRDVFH